MREIINYIGNFISVSRVHTNVKHVCILAFSAQREGLLSEASPDEVLPIYSCVHIIDGTKFIAYNF